MIKITPKFNAVIGATKDRYFIRKHKNDPLSRIDTTYYNCIVKESGPVSKNIKDLFVNWTKAYNHNIQKQNLIESINNIFRK